MGTIDNLKDMAKDFSEKAGKKTDEYVQLTQFKVETVKLKTKINDLYKKLGVESYHFLRSEEKDNSVLVTIADEIDKNKRLLKHTNQQIQLLLGKKICPECDKVNKKDAGYCSACGCALSDSKEDV